MHVTAQTSLESERARLAEAERQQRILSDVSRALVDYVGPDDAREKASTLRADAALRKPFALEELQEVLDRLLRRQPAA